MAFNFNVTYTSENNASRCGELSCPHGIIKTPAFIFCGTKAAMKALTPKQMKDAGTQIILSNTYHLMLQPGGETIHHLGGLQKITGWNGPMLTDSGGFQIFSMGYGSVADEIKGKGHSQRPKMLLKITEQGAEFKSYIDGKKYFLTPEESIRIQRNLGADFIVVLDECPPFHVDKSYTENSMRMSHRWALRSFQEWQRSDDGAQKLYGIIQGGIYPDLRDESAEFVNANDFFGMAVGGCLGTTKSQMFDVVGYTMQRLRKDRPVHLLGIGGISDIFEGVKHGIDTFDCVYPTRLARHGGALVKAKHNPSKLRHYINLRNAMYLHDQDPIEPGCPCETCSFASKGYLNHLLKAQEIVAYTLISIHNVSFMNRLMIDIRQAISSDSLSVCEKEWLE